MIVRIFVKVQADNVHVVAASVLDQGFLQLAYRDLVKESRSFAPLGFGHHFSCVGIELRTDFGAPATGHIARRKAAGGRRPGTGCVSAGTGSAAGRA